MSKTIQITKLIDMANAYLEKSPDHAVDGRHAIASYIASVLHETGNYAGFNYLGGYDPDKDQSRVFYYTTNKLK